MTSAKKGASVSDLHKNKVLIMAIMLGILAGPVVADTKASIKLLGGWAYLSAGDVNPGTQAYFAWHEARWEVSQGRYRAVHGGFELGGEIRFQLTQQIGITAGGGYLEISRSSQTFYWDTEVSGGGSVIAHPNLSAMPIWLGLDLIMPIDSRLQVRAVAAPCMLLGARYADQWLMGGWKTDTYPGYIYVTTRARKSGILIGLQGTIGLEFRLLKDVFLCLDARGRYAKSGRWEGSSVLESDSLDSFFEQGELYYESVPMLSGSPRVIMVQDAPPDGPGGKPRRAVVDFSGIVLQMGVRIRL